jgi:hypothetical protein
MKKPDFDYYRMVVSTQHDPDILQSELKDLINESVAYIEKASGSKVPLQRLVMADLRLMKEAPRDGTEILAYDSTGKNFHPIYWKASRISWAMRWNQDYYTMDNFYRGWIPYPEVKP